MGFLDNTGLTRLLNDIKSKFTAPKSLAYVESTTAKTNHAAGDHFMIGEQLKRATSAIATGESITSSNSTPATVQDQIDTLRDSLYSHIGKNTARTVSFENKRYVTVESPIVGNHYGSMLIGTNAGILALIKVAGENSAIINLSSAASLVFSGTQTATKFKLDGSSQYTHWFILAGGGISKAIITASDS